MTNTQSGPPLTTPGTVNRARYPTSQGERIFGTRQLLLLFAAYSAATWTLLFGGDLPSVGTPEMGLVSYGAGYIVGLIPVALATAVMSARYGIDTIDVTKPTFGIRGFYFPLVVVFGSTLAWTYLLTSMGAASTSQALSTMSGRHGSFPLWVTALIGILILGICWFGATSGARFFERMGKWSAPSLFVLVAILFIILVAKFGLGGIWNVRANDPLSDSSWVNFLYGFEWGVAAALAWWGPLGTFARFAKRPTQIIPSTVWGIGIIGGVLVAVPAAYAAAKTGTPDPTEWIPQIAHAAIAVVGLLFILLANITSVVSLLYVASVQLSQFPFFRRFNRRTLVTIFIVPGIYFALNPHLLVDNVMSVLTYSGYSLAGITMVGFVDIYLLRRKCIDIRAIFDERAGKEKYWFWGGINWIAVIVAGGAYVVAVFWILNPVTLEYNFPFKLMGASVPTMLGAGIIYYGLIRLIATRKGVGGYGVDQQFERRNILKTREPTDESV